MCSLGAARCVSGRATWSGTGAQTIQLLAGVLSRRYNEGQIKFTHQDIVYQFHRGPGDEVHFELLIQG